MKKVLLLALVALTGFTAKAQWIGNITAEDEPATYVGGLVGQYGIDSYAEKITNNGTATIDSIMYCVYDITQGEGAGNFTLSIMDESENILGTTTVSGWSSLQLETVKLSTPVTVNGNFYVVITVSDDQTGIIVATRSDATTSTAYVNYQGWAPVCDIFQNQSGAALYGSFFFLAHKGAGTQGIDNAQANAISVYPNPTTSLVTISGDVQQVQVIDVTGRKVMEAQTSQLDMSNLANGTYMLRVTNAEGTTYHKVVKR